jgi:DNA-binding transcriptional MocR family regulator
MQEGHFERHLRKIRKLYSKKSEMIQQELESLNIETLETNAGTHIVVKVGNTDKCINNAKKLNILLEKINDEFLIFRYRGLENEEIKQVLPLIFANQQ